MTATITLVPVVREQDEDHCVIGVEVTRFQCCIDDPATGLKWHLDSDGPGLKENAATTGEVD